jgi:thiamine-phosphate pyrophosphorylase
MSRSPGSWRLYVITDARLSRGRSHRQVVEAAIRGGADAIQLRDKEVPAGELYRAALELREIAREGNVAFLVNDRLDVALAAGADGVHVGQQDLPASVVRRILGPGRILGVTAETVEEALAAERDGADYLGVGPVFEARGTKPDAGAPRAPRSSRTSGPTPGFPSSRSGGSTRGTPAACGGRGRTPRR